MKKFTLLLMTLCVLISMSACSNQKADGSQDKTPVTDALGNTEYISKDAKVVSGYASFAEMWLISGGKLAGVTDDAVSERGIDVGDDTEIIGTVKHIDLEKVVSLNPDYVILSADLSAHLSFKESLDAMNIPYGYFREDTLRIINPLWNSFAR